MKSRSGKRFYCDRDDEPTLHFFGYKPHIYKIFAFCIAAALAGIAGMLFVPQMKIVTPSNMEAYRSVLVVVWVAVGGRSSLGGAVLGALSVNLLYNFLTSEQDLFFLQMESRLLAHSSWAHFHCGGSLFTEWLD